ncbi:MAG: poly-gamma-glutamate biosynthesis protein PgsC/CapC [Mariprofundaceae bacterium]
MDFFPLQIFPPGGLASSVVTTVWVGVFVIAFFNLRFGWVLGGLVVPGYLVPLLILKPWSVFAITVEGVVTYLLAWFFSEYLSRWGKWCHFFGRDRFFALILISVLVRITFDGWVFPLFGEYLINNYNIQFDYRDALHSLGLIIVILIANQFWKTGFVRGITPLVVPVVVTFFIVRYGLLEFTNLSLSDLGYLYEDLASSILAGPKAYIILLVAAFIASRMNLRYGWDYSGILIPALLALQWYQPMKILASFVEAFVILLVAKLILMSPMFRTASIEGGRKLLLFFNIGFAYKILLGYLLLAVAPEVRITDFYAFGYLLSTLIAIKMYDKDIAVKMTRTVLQTSLVAVFAASVVGFSLTFLPNLWTWSVPSGAVASPVVFDRSGKRLTEVVRDDQVELYKQRPQDSFESPLPQEIDLFTEGVRSILRYADDRDKKHLDEAAAQLSRVDYQITLLEDRYIYLKEGGLKRGWGIYVIDLLSTSRLLVEVPSPVDEWGAMNAGALLFKSMQGKGLAIAGVARDTNLNQASDVLANYNTLFHAFHKTMARRDVLQVRGYTQERARKISGKRRDIEKDIDLPDLRSALWVKGTLPPDLNMVLIKDMIDGFDIHWANTSLKNIQRDSTRSGFAELVLNRKDVRKLMSRYLLSEFDLQLEVREQRIDGYLQDWLLSGKGQIAEKGSNLYVPPRVEELLFFDQEVLTPLLDIASRGFSGENWTESGLEELRAIAISAAAVNYRIIRYRHRLTKSQYIILTAREDVPDRHYWGTYVLRLGAVQNFVVQVPRPLFELSSFEYGVSLFERLNARALLISGAHFESNQNRKSDLIKVENKENIFNLVNQVLLRESGDQALLVMQCRGFGGMPGQVELPDGDVLLSFNDGVFDEAGLSKLGNILRAYLQDDGLEVNIVDGGEETIGYDGGGMPQAMYMPQSRNKEFAVLWLSPLLRQAFRQQTENRVQEAKFDIFEIPAVFTEFQSYIDKNKPWGKSSSVPTGLRSEIAHYMLTQDVITLQKIRKQWPGFSFERLIDVNTRQDFIAVYSAKRLLLLANLHPRQPEKSFQINGSDDMSFISERFVGTRSGWLEFGG